MIQACVWEGPPKDLVLTAGPLVKYAQQQFMTGYLSDGKGSKDRVTMLPESVKARHHDHVKTVKAIHERDLAEGWGRVPSPGQRTRSLAAGSLC